MYGGDQVYITLGENIFIYRLSDFICQNAVGIYVLCKLCEFCKLLTI